MSHRSKYFGINLPAIVKTSDINKYGIDVVSQKFYDEMRDFCSKGFEVVTSNNESLDIKKSLAGNLADRSAAHQIMAIKEGVGFVFRKFRYCLTTTEEINKNIGRRLYLERYRNARRALQGVDRKFKAV
ncbi:unnamed protein product [Clavelina lepadiformis]|uniref:Uncharacterized protein n=1 Tax=Clavelina lepadiformis TaxID=159417 RepID=A0ABP0G6A5_CLALP